MTDFSPGFDQGLVHTERAHATSPKLLSGSHTNQMMMRIACYGLLTLVFASIVSVYDEPLTLLVKHSQNAWRVFLGSISDVGKSENFLVPALLIIVAVWLLRKWSAQCKRANCMQLLSAQAAFLFAAVALSGIITDIVKPLIGRTRPKLLEWYGAYHFVPLSIESTYLSMPSGHATTMGAVTCSLCIWFPTLRYVILPIGFLLALTRYFALAHYFSDVIAGFGWGYVFTLLLAIWLKHRNAGICVSNGRLAPTSDYLKFHKVFS